MSKKSILQKILGVLARATIRKYQPMIIAVTGSVGKTSTRMAIFAMLKNKFSVRTAEKNYNNEIGVALAILGIPHGGRNVLKWAGAIARAATRVIIRHPDYPGILVLEYGVDRPGDMDYLLSLAVPDIAVVTAMGDVPAHVEFFENPEEVVREKAKLVSALKHEGFAILNHDDYAVYDMKGRTKAHVLTYGQEEHAEIRIVNYELRTGKDAELGDIPAGISFKVDYKGSVVPVRLNDTFGMPQVYAAAAAAAVGIALKMNPVRSKIAEASADLFSANRASNGMNLVDISGALHGYVPPPGRMRGVKGNKHSFILDDTYNASPEAMRAALDTLNQLPAKRKIAVLGDMLEIGKYTEIAHRSIGDKAAQFVDVLVTVGARAKFIADEAMARGLNRTKIFTFDDARTAGRALDPMIQAGDLILIKGSQGMRMERVVEEIMAHPEQADRLLVRQEKYWKITS